MNWVKLCIIVFGIMVLFSSHATGAVLSADTQHICSVASTFLNLISQTGGFLSPPATARALSIYTTCMWDAVAPYTPNMLPVIANNGINRRPSVEWTNDNQRIAATVAAYRAAVDIFQAHAPLLLGPMAALVTSQGVDPSDVSNTDLTTPLGIANVACAAVLQFRHQDGMNQLGDQNNSATATPYSDYTNYVAVNPPQAAPSVTTCSALRSLAHWQPLRVPLATGGSTVQSFAVPYAFHVTPFSLLTGLDLLSVTPGPALVGTRSDAVAREQAAELVSISANLDDTAKVIAEYWADAAGTFQPPGHWHSIAVEMVQQRNLPLLSALELLFLQGQAAFDSGIAAWSVKRLYDSVRPITLLQCLYANQNITSWKGPYQGSGIINGSSWIPYQSQFVVTPPFAEYCSGHSTFSASSAQVLALYLGSDLYGGSVTVPAGSSIFEPMITNASQPGYIAGLTDTPNSGLGTAGYTPAAPVTLTWNTFSDAADQAGFSRRYGGIHFAYGDLHARALGRAIGNKVWAKYQTLFVQNSQPQVTSSDSLTSNQQAAYSVAGSVAGSFAANLLFGLLVLLIFLLCRPRASPHETSKAASVKTPRMYAVPDPEKRVSIKMDNPALELPPINQSQN